MSRSIPGNHKHLTIHDRLYIEHSLDANLSLRDISRFLCKDPTTISKEIRLHRRINVWNRGSFNNPYNFCIHRFRCKKMNACDKIVICDALKGNAATGSTAHPTSATAATGPGTSAP